MKMIKNEVPQEIEVIREQIKLLADWNKENIKLNPEQVRKNVETVLAALDWIKNYD